MAGVRERPELGTGIASLHVARNGYKGRHMVIFRVISAQEISVIKVLRLLHDRMDLQRHDLFTDKEYPDKE